MKRVLRIIDEIFFVLFAEDCADFAPSGEEFGNAHPFRFESGDRTGEHRFRNGCRGNPEFERRFGSPASGPLLSGAVKDHVDHRTPRFGIGELQNFRGDFKQITSLRAIVPAAEDFRKFIHGIIVKRTQKQIRFRDQLHVGIFDSVVYRFDEMSGAARPDPFAAGRAVGRRCGDFFEQRFNERARFAVSPGHERGTFQGALFSSGNTGSDKRNFLFREHSDAPFGVAVVGVAAVDENISRFEVRQQLRNDVVDCASRLDHHHDSARPPERGAKLCRRICGQNVFAVGASGDEFAGAFGRTVVNSDGEAFGLHVQNKILPHHSESDHADVGKFFFRHVMTPSLVLCG